MKTLLITKNRHIQRVRRQERHTETKEDMTYVCEGGLKADNMREDRLLGCEKHQETRPDCPTGQIEEME